MHKAEINKDLKTELGGSRSLKTENAKGKTVWPSAFQCYIYT